MSREFNAKEQKMLEHFRTIIEHREFDEYDIFCFFIFIREFVANEAIRDFANTLAHRERSGGRVHKSTVTAKANAYHYDIESLKVDGYHGIEYQELFDGFRKIGQKYIMVP